MKIEPGSMEPLTKKKTKQNSDMTPTAPMKSHH